MTDSNQMTKAPGAPEAPEASADVPTCVECPIRAKAEAKPRSIIGFIWRLHTKICPGWKKYQRWLAEQEAAGSEAAGSEAA